MKITIVNPDTTVNSPEKEAAESLQEMLRHSIPNEVQGEIRISYSMTLCGPVRDIDLLIVGKLKNYILPDCYTNDPQYAKKSLEVNGFCTILELKDHDYSKVCMKNTHIYVDYKGYLKDATEQNEKQRYSLLSYINNVCGYKPFVTNLLWLRGLSPIELKALRGNVSIGAIPSTFTFKEFINTLLQQGAIPYYSQEDKHYHLNYSYNNEDLMADLTKHVFSPAKKEIKGLTRKKLELIAQNRASKANLSMNFGKNLVIFEGRAGTGKTIRLLQAALQLANHDTGDRCLLLTYNHALVADIRRLLHFMNVPDRIDSNTVQINTLHSFFIGLMNKTTGVTTQELFTGNFEANYAKALCDLSTYVTELMCEKDVEHLKDDYESAIDWDYLLIDEAQDWSDMEKHILFKIYGSERIIVADGVDQFIRTGHRQNWARKVNVCRDSQQQGLRQKANLTRFVNQLSEEMGLSWKVKPNEQFPGGKVIIRKDYTVSLHNSLVTSLHSQDCENYDMLFLVPPSLVEHESGTHFKNFDKWKQKGIIVFDGTNSSNRVNYSVNPEECRLYQYDSCRGLEGWITVCLQFDKLIEYKLEEAHKIDFSNDLDFISPEHSSKKYAYLWSLMPLTRPIDTLVITIKDPNSESAQLMYNVSKRNDWIDWQL